MSRLVVLGADGFIGRHLIGALAKNSKLEIVAFDRFSAYQNGEKHFFEDLDNVQIIAGNFFNRSDVESILEKDDYVFHLISSTNPASSNDDPFIDIDTNIRSSVELFELCVQKDIKKVMYFSSGGTVYGDIDSGKINENTAAQPRSPYGIGKLTIESYLRYFKFAHGLDYIVYRIANPYGPGQNIFGKQGVVPIFMHRFLTKSDITVFGDGEMIRDYLYIDDLVAAIIGSYAISNKYSEYNIGSGIGTSVNQLISAIESVVGSTIPKEYKETPATYVEKSVLDNSRFTQEFNILPTVALTDGIGRTWEYVKSLEIN